MTILDFPIKSSCTGCTLPGLTTPELRERAVANYYTAERRKGVDICTAWNRSQAFGDDLERIAGIMSADSKARNGL